MYYNAPCCYAQFMTEMKETAFVMQNVSQRYTVHNVLDCTIVIMENLLYSGHLYSGDRSLIVMDELGRATSSSDGFAIAWSCCEHLLSLNA